jgi:hypothetical protein
MAELLVVVVVAAAAALVLYVVDRARKLRARARQMSGMNDRLDVAAAKIDEEQLRKRARVRASAELTSVLPAIKRPPLTIPGMGGPGGDEESAPAGESVPAREDSPAAEDSPATEPAQATGPDQPAEEAAAAGEARPAAETPATAEAAAAGNGPAAAEAPAPGGVPLAPAPRLAEGTLSMPAAVPADDIPAARTQVTSEGTMIMPPVPGHGPERAGGARAAADQTAVEHTSNQERSSRR